MAQTSLLTQSKSSATQHRDKPDSATTTITRHQKEWTTALPREAHGTAPQDTRRPRGRSNHEELTQPRSSATQHRDKPDSATTTITRHQKEWTTALPREAHGTAPQDTRRPRGRSNHEELTQPRSSATQHRDKPDSATTTTTRHQKEWTTALPREAHGTAHQETRRPRGRSNHEELTQPRSSATQHRDKPDSATTTTTRHQKEWTTALPGEGHGTAQQDTRRARGRSNHEELTQPRSSATQYRDKPDSATTTKTHHQKEWTTSLPRETHGTAHQDPRPRGRSNHEELTQPRSSATQHRDKPDSATTTTTHHQKEWTTSLPRETHGTAHQDPRPRGSSNHEELTQPRSSATQHRDKPDSATTTTTRHQKEWTTALPREAHATAHQDPRPRGRSNHEELTQPRSSATQHRDKPDSATTTKTHHQKEWTTSLPRETHGTAHQDPRPRGRSNHEELTKPRSSATQHRDKPDSATITKTRQQKEWMRALPREAHGTAHQDPRPRGSSNHEELTQSRSSATQHRDKLDSATTTTTHHQKEWTTALRRETHGTAHQDPRPRGSSNHEELTQSMSSATQHRDKPGSATTTKTRHQKEWTTSLPREAHGTAHQDPRPRGRSNHKELTQPRSSATQHRDKPDSATTTTTHHQKEWTTSLPRETHGTAHQDPRPRGRSNHEELTQPRSSHY